MDKQHKIPIIVMSTESWETKKYDFRMIYQTKKILGEM